MRLLRAGAVLFALLLLAAHSLRWGDSGQCALWLGLCLLPLLRQAWTRYVLQGALLLGAWQWLQAGATLVQLRIAFGDPWIRLTIIMALLVLLTLGAVLALRHNSLDSIFFRNRETAWPQALAFGLTFWLLWIAQIQASMPLLLGQRFFPSVAGVGLLQTAFHALYAALLAGVFMTPARHRAWRPRIWGLFSLLFFAQLALGLAGVHELLMTGRLHLPVPAVVIGGPLYRGHGFFMPILFLSTVLLAGPAWCSHLCYIGAWDDGCSRLSGRKPQSPDRAPLRGRLITLVLTVAVALCLRFLGVDWLPAILLAALFGLGGVAVMLTLSRARGRMVHCTQWCPLGLVSVLLARLTPWRMRMSDGCTQCGACSRVCRYGALRPSDLAAGKPGLSCTLCGDCVASCKQGHLHYHFAGLQPHHSRALFITLASSLHAGFLAVARI